MPWSVERVALTRCLPKGQASHLDEAISTLGLDDPSSGNARGEAAERIEELAIAFNGQRALANDAPTIKDVRARLERVKKTMDAAIKALSALDDVSIDWLLGAANLPPLFFSLRPMWSAARALPAVFSDDVGASLSRRDCLAASIERLRALQDMAVGALKEFNEWATAGGPRSVVEIVMDSAKSHLVAGCYQLAEEYLNPLSLTSSVATSAPLARLARATFEYATGERVDDAGNSLDRAIADVVGDRKRNPSEGWDQLNSILRQEHTKPR